MVFGDYHSVDIIYGHCRVVCARGLEVKAHVGLEFSFFSSVPSRCSIRKIWEELGARWVMPRMGSSHHGARLLWEELWVLISSGVKYEECKILF